MTMDFLVKGKDLHATNLTRPVTFVRKKSESSGKKDGMETRKHGTVLNHSARISVSSEIPVDYTKMVQEVMSNHFGEMLAPVEKKFSVLFSWHIYGRIFADEIVLAASLLPNSGITATTGFASIDFDPKASQPTAEEALSVCVDAMGTLFDALLGDGPNAKKNREALLDESLGAFVNIPLEWAELEVQNKRVYVRFDRSNPKLDQLATDWLSKHDPLLKDMEEDYEEETADLFFRGPRPPKNDDDEDEES
jgi:hypothetical protein